MPWEQFVWVLGLLAAVGAGAGLLLCIKDVVRARIDRGASVNPTLRLFFGMGVISLALWCPSVIAMVFGVTMLTIPGGNGMQQVRRELGLDKPAAAEAQLLPGAMPPLPKSAQELQQQHQKHMEAMRSRISPPVRTHMPPPPPQQQLPPIKPNIPTSMPPRISTQPGQPPGSSNSGQLPSRRQPRFGRPPQFRGPGSFRERRRGGGSPPGVSPPGGSVPGPGGGPVNPGSP